MFKRFKKRFRHRLLQALRPGKSHRELLTIIERAESILSDEQRRMFEAMIHFHDTRVREIMLPRADIRAVDLHTPLQEVAEIMAASNESRLPVMQGDVDHIVGVLHLKDLFQAQLHARDVSLSDLMRPHLTVSELAHVPRLLIDMRESQKHLAIVLDEFGGTTGLISFTLLLEEIIGSMDEHAPSESHEYVRGDNGCIEVSARMHVEDLQELLKVELPTGDYDTVGGLILTELGRIPTRGERFFVAGLDVHIQEADPRRILRVLIKPNP